MRQAILAAALCAGLAACSASDGGSAFGPIHAATAEANRETTRDYYASLIAGPSPNIAGLYSSFAAANAGGRVVGVNIVGPENGPVSMRDYPLHMRMFAFLK